jgi:16S rRNA (guanine966-N2)-methyltransferase
MRIIAGKYKGLQLVSFNADHIRPTTDRVKESIFNKWMTLLEDARCLDLFSGTGNLSLEALSRGARRVVAVEKSKQSLKILRENLEKLKVPKEDIQVVQDDVFRFLKNFDGEAFDLIFLDPPFTEKWAHELMQALAVSRVFKPGTHIMIESGTKEAISDQYSPLELLDRRAFGDKTVSYFVCPNP